MKSVISELWNGEIAPCEHCGAQDTLANILFSKRKQGRETMEKILPEERRDVLESYSQLWEDYLLRMMELSFQEGLVLACGWAGKCSHWKKEVISLAKCRKLRYHRKR